jgi:hypothetical protein
MKQYKIQNRSQKNYRYTVRTAFLFIKYSHWSITTKYTKDNSLFFNLRACSIGRGRGTRGGKGRGRRGKRGRGRRRGKGRGRMAVGEGLERREGEGQERREVRDRIKGR